MCTTFSSIVYASKCTHINKQWRCFQDTVCFSIQTPRASTLGLDFRSQCSGTQTTAVLVGHVPGGFFFDCLYAFEWVRFDPRFRFWYAIRIEQSSSPRDVVVLMAWPWEAPLLCQCLRIEGNCVEAGRPHLSICSAQNLLPPCFSSLMC